MYAALLYNAHVKGFIEGEIYTGPIKNVCVPGFNCYSCPGAIGACPLGALQNTLASSGARAPYYVLGILMLFGLTLGRTICGWLCPLGLIQELFYKIPTPKLKKNRFTRVLSWLKYVILGVFVVGIPLVYSVQNFPVPGFCKYICPAGTSEGAMGLLANAANAAKFSMLNILFTRKFIIMVVIFVSCIFIYRMFCRFLCPLGAIYGLFAKLSLLGVKVEASKCTHCGKCVSQCKMDIRRVGDHECIHCGECINVCPTKAIEFKCGKITLMKNEGAVDKPNEKARKVRSGIAWVVALAVLAGVMWYVNQPAPQETITENIAVSDLTDTQTQTEQPAVNDVETGIEVGMRCPTFTVPLLTGDGGAFTPGTGKVTVINFWGTYCTPCIAELPLFQALYDKYPDQIDMIAIHAFPMIQKDVDAFLARESYTIPFGADKDGKTIRLLGGSTTLPMTVILDQNGVIVLTKIGSMTQAMLDDAVTPLLQ